MFVTFWGSILAFLSLCLSGALIRCSTTAFPRSNLDAKSFFSTLLSETPVDTVVVLKEGDDPLLATPALNRPYSGHTRFSLQSLQRQALDANQGDHKLLVYVYLLLTEIGRHAFLGLDNLVTQDTPLEDMKLAMGEVFLGNLKALKLSLSIDEPLMEQLKAMDKLMLQRLQDMAWQLSFLPDGIDPEVNSSNAVTIFLMDQCEEFYGVSLDIAKVKEISESFLLYERVSDLIEKGNDPVGVKPTTRLCDFRGLIVEALNALVQTLQTEGVPNDDPTLSQALKWVRYLRGGANSPGKPVATDGHQKFIALLKGDVNLHSHRVKEIATKIVKRKGSTELFAHLLTNLYIQHPDRLLELVGLQKIYQDQKLLGKCIKDEDIHVDLSFDELVGLFKGAWEEEEAKAAKLCRRGEPYKPREDVNRESTDTEIKEMEEILKPITGGSNFDNVQTAIQEQMLKANLRHVPKECVENLLETWHLYSLVDDLLSSGTLKQRSGQQ